MNENVSLFFLNKLTRGIIGSLIVQFILGMIINLFAVAPQDPKFATESPIFKIVFLLHGLNGVVLPIFALSLLFFAFKNGRVDLKRISSLGFISILVAAGGGIATIILKNTLSEIASFVMSLGFIFSLVSYGKLYLLAKKAVWASS